MKRNCRDLANAGLYLCALVLTAGSVAYAGATAVAHIPDMVSSAVVGGTSVPQNRLSEVVASAREIRAALARPIPGPAPLPPITAKLAHGHLKQGGAVHAGARRQGPASRHPGHDAMAMEPPVTRFRASSVVAPELHKVY